MNPHTTRLAGMRGPARYLMMLMMTTAMPAAGSAPDDGPLRILCVGDSITQGGDKEAEYTYRLPLQVILRQQGVSFDFIGSRQAGLDPDFSWPEAAGEPFDPDHEGYYGWKTAAVLEKLRGNLPDLPAPDVALIHLGTNDQRSDDYPGQVGKPLSSMIDLLRAKNPGIIILLGHLNFRDGAAADIRPVVEEVARLTDRPESPVRTVRHYLGWRADPERPWPDTFDWAHPNPSGQRKMAEAWVHALRPLLDARAAGAARKDPPPPSFTEAERARFGHGVERFMALLAASGPGRRHTARILIYGQSISEDAWWRLLVAKLEARYPHARIIAENRSLGGFGAKRLVRAVETDLKAFDPDLVLFHVFGSDSDYEDIIRTIRENTTADILLQTDHIGAGHDWQDEPTDPSKITRDNWGAFMNYVHLPQVAETYGCGLLPQRDVWKRYLLAHDLDADALLRDQIHLNPHGNRLMAEIVDAHLVERDDTGIDPFHARGVRTLVIGEDIHPEDDRIELTFEGNRVDLIAGPDGAPGEFTLHLDGRPPSQNRDCFAFSRATPLPGSKWPALTGIVARALPVAETWTLDVRSADGAADGPHTFRLTGSVTGDDGSGSSDRPFVSNSGRVAFDPRGWDVAHAMRLAGVDEVPPEFRIVFDAFPLSPDTIRIAPPPDPGLENAVTAITDLPPGRHVLTVEGPIESLRALRVHNPGYR